MSLAPSRPASHSSPAPSSILSSPHPRGSFVRSADYEDWANLKELFARAADRYDADDVQQALPLLRAVIRECHRFLLDHPDPSVVYAHPSASSTRSTSPGTVTPTEHRDWIMDSDPGPPLYPRRRSITRRSSAELPTAFHAIFGISLFLMGNLVAHDPSIVLPGEPDAPSAYWLAALDVFETGENLPSRTWGSSLDTTEDWRMAIVWGRTLVSLADEKVSYHMNQAKAHAEASDAPAASTGEYGHHPASSSFSMSEPQYPPTSPFHAIAQFRPPVTRRMSLYSASAHDLMVLAMDQFSRGIFHMPHPHYSHSHNPSFIHTPGTAGSPAHTSGYFSSGCAPPSHYSSPSGGPLDGSLSFSRPKELFTIASEVLGVAERLTSASQRHYWASWADSVFNQMKNEADMDAWRGPILSARGRCWLVMGSAPVEDMEAALEAGQTEVLHSAEAEEAREGRAMRAFHLERSEAAPDAEGTVDVVSQNPLAARFTRTRRRRASARPLASIKARSGVMPSPSIATSWRPRATGPRSQLKRISSTRRLTRARSHSAARARPEASYIDGVRMTGTRPRRKRRARGSPWRSRSSSAPSADPDAEGAVDDMSRNPLAARFTWTRGRREHQGKIRQAACDALGLNCHIAASARDWSALAAHAFTPSGSVAYIVSLARAHPPPHSVAIQSERDVLMGAAGGRVRRRGAACPISAYGAAVAARGQTDEQDPATGWVADHARIHNESTYENRFHGIRETSGGAGWRLVGSPRGRIPFVWGAAPALTS